MKKCECGGELEVGDGGDCAYCTAWVCGECYDDHVATCLREFEEHQADAAARSAGYVDDGLVDAVLERNALLFGWCPACAEDWTPGHQCPANQGGNR